MRYLSDIDGIEAMIAQLSRDSRGSYAQLPDQITHASRYHSRAELQRGQVKYNGAWYHYNSANDTLTLDTTEQLPDTSAIGNEQQLAML